MLVDPVEDPRSLVQSWLIDISAREISGPRDREISGHRNAVQRRCVAASSMRRALVRDELQGRLDLRNDGGTRAEVVFPTY